MLCGQSWRHCFFFLSRDNTKHVNRRTVCAAGAHFGSYISGTNIEDKKDWNAPPVFDCGSYYIQRRVEPRANLELCFCILYREVDGPFQQACSHATQNGVLSLATHFSLESRAWEGRERWAGGRVMVPERDANTAAALEFVRSRS